MAAPHVSGVAALVWSANPDLEHEDVRRILIETALEIGERDQVGAGLVQALDAVHYAIEEYEPDAGDWSLDSFVSPDCDLPGDFYLDGATERPNGRE